MDENSVSDCYRVMIFDPKEDITTFELAQVFGFACTVARGNDRMFPIKAYTEQDWAVLRLILQDRFPQAVRHLRGVSGWQLGDE